MANPLANISAELDAGLLRESGTIALTALDAKDLLELKRITGSVFIRLSYPTILKAIEIERESK